MHGKTGSQKRKNYIAMQGGLTHWQSLQSCLQYLLR